MKLLSIEELNSHDCDYREFKSVKADCSLMLAEQFEFLLKKPIYNDVPLIYVLFKVKGLAEDFLMNSYDRIAVNLSKGDEVIVYTHKNMEITSSSVNILGISE